MLPVGCTRNVSIQLCKGRLLTHLFVWLYFVFDGNGHCRSKRSIANVSQVEDALLASLREKAEHTESMEAVEADTGGDFDGFEDAGFSEGFEDSAGGDDGGDGGVNDATEAREDGFGTEDDGFGGGGGDGFGGEGGGFDEDGFDVDFNDEAENATEPVEDMYELDAVASCTKIYNAAGGAWTPDDGRNSYRKNMRTGLLEFYGGAVVTARKSTGPPAPRNLENAENAENAETTEEAAVAHSSTPSAPSTPKDSAIANRVCWCLLPTRVA